MAVGQGTSWRTADTGTVRGSPSLHVYTREYSGHLVAVAGLESKELRFLKSLVLMTGLGADPEQIVS